MGSSNLDTAIKSINIEAYLTGILGLERHRSSKSAKEFATKCLACGRDGKLNVSLTNGLWHCHACGQGGNLTTLTGRIKWIDNKAAARFIYEFAGMELPRGEGGGRKRTEGCGGRSGDGGGDGDGGRQAKAEAAAASEAAGAEEAQMEPDLSPPSSSPSQVRAAYDSFIELATLTDAHREELRSKRGFTDATIDALRFRSGGPQNKPVIDALRAVYGEGTLLEAGILTEVNGKPLINSQLRDDRIIIPYLDPDGKAYHIRPHKLGFEGVPAQPYQRLFLAGKPERVVLCEGEFKAAALWQCGIPALAIPGTSSFSDKNYDRLVEVLRQHGTKAVTVVFDNEEKGDPALKEKFKARVDKRYDTQYWSYLMAFNLGRDGFVARVGWLPDEWRGRDGKADWDFALACGHTAQEFEAVIERAVTPKEYLDGLPEEAQRIVRRKLAKHFARVPVKRDFGHYVALRMRNGETYEEVVSNFIVNIKTTYETPDGRIRNVQLRNEYNETSGVFPMEAGDISGPREFRKFLLGKGNFVFKGNAGDLNNILDLEFLRDTGEVIWMLDRIGQIGKEGLWLFGNLAVRHGQVYYPDDDGIVWIEGKGYKPLSLNVSSRGEASADAIASLSEDEIDILEIANRMVKAVGGFEAYMGIGWVIATLFSEPIFRRFHFIPILYACGPAECGKSTFIRWIMSMLGVDYENGIGIKETTQNFIARALSYYSSLGVWFDEYRNEPRVTEKDGYLRSAYNRQFSGKGTATAFQTRGFEVRGTLALSGEEIPKDPGLKSRLVTLQFSKYKRNRREFEWLQNRYRRFSNFALQVLRRYDELKEPIVADIYDLRQALIDRGVNDRVAENWAVCAAPFCTAILGDNNPLMGEFIRWVEQRAQEVKLDNEESTILAEFWEDVSYLVSQRELNNKHLAVKEGKLLCWWGGVFRTWALFYRKKAGRDPFDQATVKRYLTAEPYYEEVKKNVWFAGQAQKCFAINLDKATETLKEIAEHIEQFAPGNGD